MVPVWAAQPCLAAQQVNEREQSGGMTGWARSQHDAVVSRLQAPVR
jgi:hypothetical protein